MAPKTAHHNAMPASTAIFDLERIVAETFLARAKHYPELGSTNDRAKDCVGDGGPLPLLIIADRQTAGRGRGTNRWWTGEGGLAFSVLLGPNVLPKSPRRAPLVALAAGVAVVNAARPLLDGQPLGIHWPNDVMVGQHKLAGVLVEVTPDRSHVVGIGLNTNNSAADAPAEIRDRIVTLKDLTGRVCDQTDVLIDVLQCFQRTLEAISTRPEQLAARAGALCLQVGRMLTMRVGGQSTMGRCIGIDRDGALLLDTPDGQRAFRSGTLRQ